MAARVPRSRNPERTMSLGAHLVELRKRLFRAAIAVIVGAIIGWAINGLIWDQLRAPILVIANAHHASITFTTITSAFDLKIQIAIIAGIVISSPVWLYQLFAFFVPGLTRRERGYTLGFLLTAIPLFLAGCAAGWYVLPHIVELMATFVPPEDASLLDARYYLDFVLKLVVATGVAFVLPVFLVLLNFVGVLQGKTILKGWRWAVLAIVLFTAIATPAADVVSMFLLAIPMVVLYFSAVVVALWHDKIIARRVTTLEAGLTGA